VHVSAEAEERGRQWHAASQGSSQGSKGRGSAPRSGGSGGSGGFKRPRSNKSESSDATVASQERNTGSQERRARTTEPHAPFTLVESTQMEVDAPQAATPIAATPVAATPAVGRSSQAAEPSPPKPPAADGSPDFRTMRGEAVHVSAEAEERGRQWHAASQGSSQGSRGRGQAAATPVAETPPPAPPLSAHPTAEGDGAAAEEEVAADEEDDVDDATWLAHGVQRSSGGQIAVGGAIIACTAMFDGRVALLQRNRVIIYESESGGSWRIGQVLQGSAGDRYVALALPRSDDRGLPAAGRAGGGRSPRRATVLPMMAAACGVLGDGRAGTAVYRVEGRLPRANSFAAAAAAAAPPLEVSPAQQFFCSESALDGDGVEGGGVAGGVRCACIVQVERLRGCALHTAPGQVLAAGTEEGRVHLFRLSGHTPDDTERGWVLPMPTAEHQAADSISGRAVLALSAVGGPLSLLAGAFRGGMALWQLSSRQLLATFLSEPSPSLPPAAVMPDDTVAAASSGLWVVAVPARSIAEERRCRGGSPARRGGGVEWRERRTPIGNDECVGSILVAARLGYVQHAAHQCLRAPPAAAAAAPLAIRLRLSVIGCKPEQGYFPLVDASAPPLDDGAMAPASPSPALLAGMAATAWVVAATDTRGATHLWRLHDATCIARLVAAPPSPPIGLAIASEGGGATRLLRPSGATLGLSIFSDDELLAASAAARAADAEQGADRPDGAETPGGAPLPLGLDSQSLHGFSEVLMSQPSDDSPANSQRRPQFAYE